MVKVCIIDHKLGNLTSVYNAISSLGVEVCISSKHEHISSATHLVLPGVGSFKSGMKNLHDLDLIDILNYEVLEKEKPILGICLGMHLFASTGYEGGKIKGLDWIKGSVKVMSPSKDERLPHIGWNDISLVKKSILCSGISEPLVFYFLHSYSFILDEGVATAVCDFSGGCVSMIESKNIFATQFHPEKSHDIGIKIIKNFIYKS
jgi:imidazole glycerol-phosphate synthase subunit HisH